MRANFLKRFFLKIKSRIYYFFNIYLYERIFKHQDVTLKYLFFNKKSEKLIIVFSGMFPDKARYSYVRTLQDTQYSRLYILDNFGEDGLGCYYLGTNGAHQVETTVNELIEKITKAHHINEWIFCGSSKGGWAALNFGLNYQNSTIITGAPQYNLGYYLENRRSKQLLHTVLGKSYTHEDVQNLNNIIKNKIVDNEYKNKFRIYLHISNKEHTYNEHVKFLIEDLKQHGYTYSLDVHEYETHDEVSKYFPIYLRTIINEI